MGRKLSKGVAKRKKNKHMYTHHHDNTDKARHQWEIVWARFSPPSRRRSHKISSSLFVGWIEIICVKMQYTHCAGSLSPSLVTKYVYMSKCSIGWVRWRVNGLAWKTKLKSYALSGGGFVVLCVKRILIMCVIVRCSVITYDNVFYSTIILTN